MKSRFSFSGLVIMLVAGNLASCAQPIPAEHEKKPSAILTGKAYAYDGDSLFFSHRVEVRLSAIDAPEKDQACKDREGDYWPCGLTARDALRRLIGAGEVRCRITGRDKYRRLLGTCYANGADLGAAMVRSGNAIAYHYFSEKYAGEEKQAKARQLGIWQDANFTDPYYCRHAGKGHICYRDDEAE